MEVFINNILWPGPPRAQPVGDLRAAQSAIFLGFINILASPAYVRRRLCDGGGRLYDAGQLQQERYYQLASFAVAMLGVALLAVDTAFSAAAFSSPLLLPVVRCMVWLAKVVVGGAVQLGLSVLHLCLKMLCDRLILVFT